MIVPLIGLWLNLNNGLGIQLKKMHSIHVFIQRIFLFKKHSIF